MKRIVKHKRYMTRRQKSGVFYLLFCLCISLLPIHSIASSTTNQKLSNQQDPSANWTTQYFNNDSFKGNPIKSANQTLNASPIKYTYPKDDQIQFESFHSIRSITSTKIQNGKYYVNAEFIGKFVIYVDNKLVLSDEAFISSKKVKKSILISDLLNKSASRDIHTIRIEHSNFQSNPILSISLNPILQSVNLTEKDLSYNWGYYSPIGHSNDFFNLSFENKSMYKQGDYFASIYTEDYAKILFDEKKIIESNPASNNMLNNAVIENVSEGEHTVKTDFSDLNGGEASIHSTILPFSTWIAYYFNNTAFTGLPVAKQTIKSQESNLILRASNEANSPIPGVVAKNYYGVRYITYKRLPAGTYQLQYKSGEGVGVWLDGKQIAYDWKDGKKPLRKLSFTVSDDTLHSTSKDIHQITVRTYNRKNPQNLFVSITPFMENPVTQLKTVVIDPGHGGKDTGAVGIGGLKEKDVVLDVSKRVEALFKELTPYTVYLTRSTDLFIPLGQRPAFAISKKAHAFVSVHANAGNSSASGLETYYYGIKPSSSTLNKHIGSIDHPFFSSDHTGVWMIEPNASKTNPYITDSKALATFIQKRMVSMYQLPDRGSKHGNFQVIRANNLPAVLTELGFVTNKNDASKLSSTYWRQIAAEAIYMGILDFFESKGSDVSSYKLS